MLCNWFAVERVLLARCFEKYHFNSRFCAFDRSFYFFNGSFNFVGYETVAQGNVRINQYLPGGKVHGQQLNDALHIRMTFNCPLDRLQDLRARRLAE